MVYFVGVDIDATDSEGISALGWACLRGRLGCVSALLDRGASVTIADSAGRTPLCLACGGHPNIVEALLEKGAKVEWVDHNGIRPLDRAIGQKNIQVRLSPSSIIFTIAFGCF